MPYFIVNRNAYDGHHEVHLDRDYHSDHDNCETYPAPHNIFRLGEQDSCKYALVAADNAGYSPADGCAFCCSECHSR